MSRIGTVSLSLAAGLLGGLLSHYVAVKPVLAQFQPQPQAPSQAVAPKDVRAQNFTLVNDKGVAFGRLGFDNDGNAVIRLMDKSGKMAWRSDGKGVPQQLAADLSH